MRHFLVVLALAVAGCQAHTQTTHQNYLKTWNDRLETYRERYVELDIQIRQGSERVVEAMGASDIRAALESFQTEAAVYHGRAGQ